MLLIHGQFLSSHAAIPALQFSRASASLRKALEWRRYSEPRALLSDVECLLPELDLCHITLCHGQYVLWVGIDDRAIKAHSQTYQNLATPAGIVKLGLALMEKLATLLLAESCGDPSYYSASCVVHFRTRTMPATRKELLVQTFQSKLCRALEELVTLIRSYYPEILGKAYIINPSDEYLTSLDIPESLLRNTVLLQNPHNLADYLGSQIPPEYGGIGKPLTESDFLPNSNFHLTSEESRDSKTQTQSDSTAVSTIIRTPDAQKDIPTSPSNPEPMEEEPRLIYSETIGPPSIILDPDDLKTAVNLCPGKMGASLAFADSDMIVKYGHGVRLAEAEALHLVSTCMTIAAPKLLSAYILDGTGYIIVSYEQGEPLEHYWDRVSEGEQNRILEQLRDYGNQMRDITGNFIGGLDESPCRDGIFEAGYGDYTRYSYGPYPSEETFNEGIVQALRDRLSPKTLAGENDTESTFFNSEYILHQTVRGLKGHRIVFTHGDLHPGNIIVKDDGTVVLLDWGLAGFWPEYWEFYRAMFSPGWRASWDRMVERFIPPYYVEYSVIKRVFGTVWN